MESAPPWEIGGHLHKDVATAITEHLGEDAAGVEPPNHHHKGCQLHLSRGHLPRFDGIRRISFHPKTQSFEHVERRHTSSRSVFLADVTKEVLETYEARRTRVKGDEADCPDTVWATGSELLPRERAEVDRLDRAA